MQNITATEATIRQELEATITALEDALDEGRPSMNLKSKVRDLQDELAANMRTSK